MSGVAIMAMIMKRAANSPIGWRRPWIKRGSVEDVRSDMIPAAGRARMAQKM